jgi:hypothetical protein
LSLASIILGGLIILMEFFDTNLLFYIQNKREIRKNPPRMPLVIFFKFISCGYLDFTNIAISNISLFLAIFSSQSSLWMYLTIEISLILGYFFHSSILAYSLILILWELDLTKEVIFSVTQHWEQVLATIILSIIV